MLIQIMSLAVQAYTTSCIGMIIKQHHGIDKIFKQKKNNVCVNCYVCNDILYLLVMIRNSGYRFKVVLTHTMWRNVEIKKLIQIWALAPTKPTTTRQWTTGNRVTNTQYNRHSQTYNQSREKKPKQHVAITPRAINSCFALSPTSVVCIDAISIVIDLLNLE